MIVPADAATPAQAWQHWLPLALVAAVGLAYLPSLPGGFLNYDDPWLIRDNPVFGRPLAQALHAIWLDLGFATRNLLGAEYLPVRDTSHLLEIRLSGGAHPTVMRVMQVLLYVAAVLLFRVALLRSLSSRWLAEIAAWLFAMHPVHVESVAWLAGRKDVLALGFVAGALALHAGASRHRPWAVPALLVGACLSKSMSVAAVTLLPAIDLVKWRRPDWRVYGVALLVVSPLAVLALHVGRTAGVPVPFWGGSRWHAAATMGPVWLRYLGLAVWPSGLSLVYDVPVRFAWDAAASAGACTILAWAGLAVLLAVRRRPLLASAWLWFVTPLLPVSQMLISVENRLADRYLFLSVMGPALLAAAAAGRLGRRGLVLGGAAVLALGSVTAARAHLFADSVRVWQDATAQTAVNALGPYQLGMALMDAGRDEEAIAALREAMARAKPPRTVGRNAVTALSRLLARRAQLEEAEDLLRRAARDWRPDPIVLGNLAEVVARRGRAEEARRLFLDVVRRFPDYAPAREGYRQHFGEPPPAPPGDADP
jgi:tetratricopeptide (TPR) repeat protein